MYHQSISKLQTPSSYNPRTWYSAVEAKSILRTYVALTGIALDNFLVTLIAPNLKRYIPIYSINNWIPSVTVIYRTAVKGGTQQPVISRPRLRKIFFLISLLSDAPKSILNQHWCGEKGWLLGGPSTQYDPVNPFHNVRRLQKPGFAKPDR